MTITQSSVPVLSRITTKQFNAEIHCSEERHRKNAEIYQV
jgi:hypothetical protein